MANFVLTYDFASAAQIHDQLMAFVRANRIITQWSQPFVGCFLLKSDAAPATITASFGDFFAGKTLHVIAPINSTDTGGILPQYLWDWLNQPQPNALGGLLGHLPRFDAGT